MAGLALVGALHTVLASRQGGGQMSGASVFL